MDRRGCAIGCAALSLFPLGQGASWIRLVGSSDSHRMLRIHADRDSLLAALIADWADQQQQIPQALKPQVKPPSTTMRVRRQPRKPSS
jgi:hypothetical protein